MKTKQFFTDEYLDLCQSMSHQQIVEFLNNFMDLHTRVEDPTKMISIKVKESLLESFKMKAKSQGLKYQTQIKKLMESWLLE